MDSGSSIENLEGGLKQTVAYRELIRLAGALSSDRREALEGYLMEHQNGICRALRKAIEADPRTSYAVARDAGMRPEQVYRLLQGFDVRLETAAALADALALELKPKARRARRRRARVEAPADAAMTAICQTDARESDRALVEALVNTAAELVEKARTLDPKLTKELESGGTNGR